MIKPDHDFISHSWNCFQLSFSPNGKHLAVATREHEGVLLFDTTEWKLSHKLKETNWPPNWLAFSPDSQLIVVTPDKEPTRCWDVQNGTLKWSLPKGGRHVTFSPDGRTLVTTKSKSLLLVDSSTGLTLCSLDGHASSVEGMVYSSDGLRVASAGKSQVWLWDMTQRKAVRLVQEKRGQINKLAFSPSGKLLSSVSQDGGVRLFCAESGLETVKFAGHDDMVWDLAFTKDGKLLITVGFDATIRIWDANTGEQVQQISFPEGTTTGVFELSPDSEIVAVPMDYPIHEVHLYCVATGELLQRLPIDGLIDPNELIKVRASPQEIAFSPRGDWLAAACDDGRTRVWKSTHWSNPN